MSDQVGTTNSTLILLILVMVLVIGLAVIAIVIIIRSRKKEQPPSIAEAKPEEPAPNSLSEPLPSRRLMAKRVSAAMAALKQLVPGSNYRYRVPWYLLVGESGSGKTSILEHLSIGSPGSALPLGTPAGLSRRWRFLDQAILIDIPGEAFLAGPGHSTDRGAWLNVLRLLSRYRPRRPLDGIVLTIPAPELLTAANEPENPERLARLDGIRERLSEAQLQLGLNLPIYVLITKADQIQGFASFCGELASEMQQDIFGWSNSHRLDAGFTSEWIDEAFDSIHGTLLHRQMEMLAGRPSLADPDGVFLFPFELQRLREPLRVLMGRTFRASAYHDAPFLRGIFFCGVVATKEAATASSSSAAPGFVPASNPLSLPLASSTARDSFLPEVESPKLVFIQHLFDFKIFLEYRIARPLAAGFFSRNRWVIAGQAASIFLLFLLAVSTAFAYRRISNLEETYIQGALQSIYNTWNNYKKESDFSPAFSLMESLNALHQNEFRSWTMPFSYVDPLRPRLQRSLEAAFEDVVLQSCKTELENRAALMTKLPKWLEQLGTRHPDRLPAAVSAEDSLSPAAQQKVFQNLGRPFSDNKHYLILQDYVTGLQALNENRSRYQTVTQAGNGSVEALVELMEYLSGWRLPEARQLSRDPYFQNLLTAATWSPLQIDANYSELTANNTLILVHDFYKKWFDDCPLTASLAALQGEVKDLEASNLHTVLQHIQLLDTALGSGSYDWTTEPFSRNDYPALGSQLDSVDFGSVLDGRVRNEVQEEGAAKLDKLRAELLEQNELVDVNSGHVRLSGPVRTFGAVLASLLELDWMNEQAPSTGVSSNFIWKESGLIDAVNLYDSYSKTMQQLLPALPKEYQDPLADIAADRFTDALNSAVLNARIMNPDRGSPASLDTALRNFSGSLPRLQQIQQALTDLGASQESAMLKRIVADQANSLLAQLDTELQSVYAPRASAAAWSGSQPLSLYLYQAESPDDLDAYLKSERERIAALGNDAAPAVQYLSYSRTTSAGEKKWASITQDLQAFQNNKPGNQISALETFIQTDLDKITPENKCKAPAARRQTDVFLSARARLAQMAAVQCQQLAIVRYNDIADFFNQKLAGRFPFSQVIPTKEIPEADPGTIADFYKLFDKESAGLTDVLPQVSADATNAVSFLNAISHARPLVTGPAGDSSPTVDLNVMLRADRDQEVNGNLIIDWQMRIGQQQIQYKPVEQKLVWHLGDPIQVVFRYAKDSPYKPAALAGSGATVEDRTVTYDYSNLWSLYAMLIGHPAPRGSAPALAAFQFPNVSAASQGQSARASNADTLVFLRIDLSSMAAKPDAMGERLTFAPLPIAAPKLTSQVIATGE